MSDQAESPFMKKGRLDWSRREVPSGVRLSQDSAARVGVDKNMHHSNPTAKMARKKECRSMSILIIEFIVARISGCDYSLIERVV